MRHQSGNKGQKPREKVTTDLLVSRTEDDMPSVPLTTSSGGQTLVIPQDTTAAILTSMPMSIVSGTATVPIESVPDIDYSVTIAKLHSVPDHSSLATPLETNAAILDRKSVV